MNGGKIVGRSEEFGWPVAVLGWRRVAQRIGASQTRGRRRAVVPSAAKDLLFL
jgi:hypothetical protein